MKEVRSVLTIAGSDSIGGAGIQADIKTIFSLGLYAASVLTAVTAQNTLSVRSIQPIDIQILKDQIGAVLEDIDIKSIKTGMLYSDKHIQTVVNCLKAHNYHKALVVDPVMVATSGDSLFDSDNFHIGQLFSMATIITPNIPEAEKISNMRIYDINTMIEAAKEILLRYKPQSVLIKAGHLEGDMTDILVRKQENINNISNGQDKEYDFLIDKIYFKGRIATNNTHGTGCTFSSAIASFLAMGFDIDKAVNLAKQYIYYAIETAKDLNLGHGHGSTNHFLAAKKMFENGLTLLGEQQ